MSDTTDIYCIANEMRDNEPIYRVEGTLTKLYPPKNTAHGQLQNGEITDGTGTIKVTFADCPQNHVTARNQHIVLECVESQTHGWTGVKVKDDATFGRAIWVTPSASVTFPNGGGGPAQQPPARNTPPPRRNAPPTQRAPQSQPRQPQRGPQQPTTQASASKQQSVPMNQFDTVEKFTSAYMYVFSLVNERMPLPPLSEDFTTRDRISAVQRAAATIFVDVAKSGVAANWNPNAKRRRFPLPPADPRDWRECYIEKEGSPMDGKKLSELSADDLRALHKYYDDKKSNSPLAECVYQAAADLKLFASPPPVADPDADVVDDDIPF